jgi:hypothetical protein
MEPGAAAGAAAVPPGRRTAPPPAARWVVARTGAGPGADHRARPDLRQLLRQQPAQPGLVPRLGRCLQQRPVPVHPPRRQVDHFYAPEARAAQLRFFDRYLRGRDVPAPPPVGLEVRERRDLVAGVREEGRWPLDRTEWTPLYLTAAGLATAPPSADGQITFGMRSRGACWEWTLPADAELTGPMALKASLRALDEQRSRPFDPVPTFDHRQPLAPGEVVPVDIALGPQRPVSGRGRPCDWSSRDAGSGRATRSPGSSRPPTSEARTAPAPCTGAGPPGAPARPRHSLTGRSRCYPSPRARPSVADRISGRLDRCILVGLWAQARGTHSQRPVAQLVESRSPKPVVGGSSPSWPATASDD